MNILGLEKFLSAQTIWMGQLESISQYFILVQSKHIHKKSSFVILVSFFGPQGLHIAMIVICACKDLIIIVHGLEIVWEKEIINIFICFYYF